MKLLLDEYTPQRLKADFTGHEIFTVNDALPEEYSKPVRVSGRMIVAQRFIAVGAARTSV